MSKDGTQTRNGKRKPAPAVRIEVITPAEIERERTARICEIKRAISQCAAEMERGKNRFVVFCEPSAFPAVEKYLADAWGEYAPEVKQALVVTARREPVKAKKGGAR